MYVKIRQLCWGLSTFHAHSLSLSMQLWAFISYAWRVLALEMLTRVITNVFLNSTSSLRIPSESNNWLLSYSYHVLQKPYKNDARFHTCCPCSIQLLLPSTVQKHDNILGSYFLLCLLRTLPLQKYESDDWYYFWYKSLLLRPNDHLPIRHEKVGNKSLMNSFKKAWCFAQPAIPSQLCISLW